MWKPLRSWAVTRDWGHIWVVTFLSVCFGVVLVPSGLSPVSGLYQIGSQAQSLQGLVPYHNEYRCGQGRNDAGWQPLGHPPDALLHQQLFECLNDRRSSLHLEQEVDSQTISVDLEIHFIIKIFLSPCTHTHFSWLNYFVKQLGFCRALKLPHLPQLWKTLTGQQTLKGMS